MKKYPLNRRLFLRGLGGAAVAAPFLPSLAERSAKAQGTTPTDPRRMILMFTHYGCLTNRWFPAKSHGELLAADYEQTNLAPLAEFAPKLLLPRGIRAMNQWDAGNTNAQSAVGQGNDPHTQVVGSYFTCQPVTPNTDDPFDLQNTAAKFNALPIGPSLDHIAAKQLNLNGGTPLFMRVSGSRDNNQTGISFSAREEPFPGIGEPDQVYSTLTGLFQSGEAPTPDDYAAIKGQSIIDLVKDDLETLERFDMSGSDRAKLEAWKELLHFTGGVVTQACTAQQAEMLGLVASEVSGTRGGIGGTDSVAGMVNDTMDWADVFSALAALSAACDANRVIVVKYPGNYVFRGLTTSTGSAISMENHNASHRIDGAGMGGACAGGVMDILNSIDQFYVRKFANLVRYLNSIPEGAGTVLDNSAAVWFQELSDGNAHNLNNLPIIHAGNCGGAFWTGGAINVDGGTADLALGDSDKYCNGTNDIPFGSVTDTGTPGNVAVAPINKYFCNLLNAIGVKADGTGFPTEGGQEAVTHFGMYDNTADFFGGGTAEPKINSPGEFAELKVAPA